MYAEPKDLNIALDNIIIYLRKSRQDDPCDPVEAVLQRHRDILNAWLVSYYGSSEIPSENVYMERVSGETIKDRVEFQKVLKRIESPYTKAVLVVEPQRLSRGDLEDMGHIINAFRYTGTYIFTQRANYDLTLEQDRKLFEMELKSGNDYLEYTKRIMARGIEASINDGKYIANIAPFGYKRAIIDRKKTLVPDENAPIVHGLFERFANGDRMKDIKLWLDGCCRTPTGKTWQYQTIRFILKNPVYIGKIRWGRQKKQKVWEDGHIVYHYVRQNGKVVNGIHQPIISEDLWAQCQERIEATEPNCKDNTILRNPLSKLAFCGKCGAVCRISPYKRKDGSVLYLFGCSKHCGGYTNIDLIMADISKKLKESIEDFEVLIKHDDESAVTAKYNEDLTNLQNRLASIEEKEIKIWHDRYGKSNFMPDEVFEKLTADIALEKSRCRESIEYMLEHKPAKKDYKKKIGTFYEASDAILRKDLPAQYINDFLRAIIDRIEYTRDRGKIGSKDDYNDRPYKLDIYINGL